MRLFLPVSMGIATFLWIIGGTVWCKNHFSEAPDLNKNVSTIAVNEGALYRANATPFFFALAQTQPIFISESIPILKKTADYLLKNNDQSLVINGFYSPKEKSLQPEIDLGILRAEAIKYVLMDLGVLAESVNVASAERNDLHFVNNQLTDGIEMRFVINESTVRFQPLNLYYSKNKYRFKESDELLMYFDNLNRFLNLNPDKRIKISVPHANTEGVRYGSKRLAFIKSFLSKREFNLNKVLFKKGSTIQKKDTRKHRVEIRLVSQ